MVIDVPLLLYFLQSLLSFPFVFLLVELDRSFSGEVNTLLYFPVGEVLLCFHPIFDGLADQRVGVGAFDVDGVEAPKILPLLGVVLDGAQGLLRVDDVLVGYAGFVG